ncbi:MAG: YbaB/EbfC family nucleoid-associated protein [Alphaproteobacteria bacterium]|jgi:hypothetical protein|nr:YbaB/EbfC family nucleoid-associated protein [Alphaproteobacteria bacterium]MDP6515965.1 YbaB/EbfC family nucleoid-associated protein [Alphaproteobacteria bacterium]
MKNLGQLLKQAQSMQTKMAELQAQLARAEVEGAAGGGMVTTVMNGKGELKRIKIDPSLADPNEIEVLEDLIVAACADAKGKAEASTAEEMKKLTGGLSLPPGLAPF